MIKYALIAIVGVFFIGCGPIFQPKPIEAQGRKITIVKYTPPNCVLLGEIDGKDSAKGTRGATYEELLDGAMNDLKNNAGYVVKDEKRAMVYITKESYTCKNGKKYCKKMKGNL
ncbi:hypothetical protein CCY99_00010 [Helicobacter sp. 16-1353]|uniref:DUF4156 domain-containing protein n=1 Tax=Helicobacter sp. 16-1353 TaxID=2004996 RepID=UPI000DCF434B|nr:DUF4156 domain-containing protein [Helicobacter sp. 16-1353]RAX55120.1 hypothetical protein CCY99_00010 [Helicobacter sp. 16-1353]